MSNHYIFTINSGDTMPKLSTIRCPIDTTKSFIVKSTRNKYNDTTEKHIFIEGCWMLLYENEKDEKYINLTSILKHSVSLNKQFPEHIHIGDYIDIVNVTRKTYKSSVRFIKLNDIPKMIYDIIEEFNLEPSSIIFGDIWYNLYDEKVRSPKKKQRVHTECVESDIESDIESPKYSPIDTYNIESDVSFDHIDLDEELCGYDQIFKIQ